ncbi:hypothetical protein MHYP_G00050920 [Metynnis hypsauchen]
MCDRNELLLISASLLEDADADQGINIAFQPFGDVMTLGKYGDPCLILVNIDGRMDTAPPLHITDKYERKTTHPLHVIGCSPLTKYSSDWLAASAWGISSMAGSEDLEAYLHVGLERS